MLWPLRFTCASWPTGSSQSAATSAKKLERGSGRINSAAEPSAKRNSVCCSCIGQYRRDGRGVQVSVVRRHLFRRDGKLLQIPFWLPRFGREFVEGIDLRLREQQSIVARATSGPLRLQLPGKHARFVAVTEDVLDDGLHVLLLIASPRKRTRVHRLGLPDLEEKRAGSLVTFSLIPAVANRRQRTTDERADDLVHQREAVTLMSAERDQILRFGRVGRGLAILVHRRIRRQLLALAR